MLGKLLKYDLKSEIKSLTPLYLAALLLPILLRIFDSLQQSLSVFKTVFAILIVLYVFTLIGVVLWTLVVCVRRFYQNVLKDEGYLTNTLPVTRNQIIIAKEISGVICVALSALVVAISTFLAFYQGGISGLIMEIKFVFEFYGLEVTQMIGWTILMSIISIISMLELCYLALMLGQTRNTNRIVCSIAFGIILYIGVQFISTIGVGIDYLINPSLMNAVNANTASLSMVQEYVFLLIATSFILTILVILVFHFVSVYLMNHKLNLE